MKRILIISIAILIIILLTIGNIIFPFSKISFKKTMSYNPDNTVIGHYDKDLLTLNQLLNYDKIKGEPALKKVSKSTIKLFSQPWLVKQNSVKVKYNDLYTLINMVETVRNNFVDLDLNRNVNLNKNSKMYLNILDQDLLALENEIQLIRESRSSDKSTLQTMFFNLHMTFSQEIKRVISFLHEYINAG